MHNNACINILNEVYFLIQKSFNISSVVNCQQTPCLTTNKWYWLYSDSQKTPLALYHLNAIAQVLALIL
jgi:hypothetical protein